jgi:hypothetical protein
MVTNWYWNKGPKYPPQPPRSCITGYKCNDLNDNGKCDPGEGVPNWKITIYKKYCGGWYKIGEVFTDGNGYYELCNICGGNYKLIEEDRDGWTHINPSNGIIEVYHPPYSLVPDQNFINKQTQPKGKIIIKKAGTDCLFPPDGMAGWWPGDGNANDIADGNNGNFAGGSYVAGKVKDAFSLTGANSVIIGESSGGAELDGFSKLTIDAWVKPDAMTPGYHAIVSKYDGSVDDGVSYWLGIDDTGKIQFSVYSDYTVSPFYSTGWTAKTTDPASDLLPTDTFTHLAGVWDGGANLYI